MKRKRRALETGTGEVCKRCGKQMKRFGHGADWKPRQNQPYYFSYWDKCNCGMLQHYERAKVKLEPHDH